MGRAPLSSEAFLLQAQHRRWRKESDVHSPAAAKAHKVSGVTAQPSPPQKDGRSLSKEHSVRAEPLQSVEQQFAEMIENIFPLPGKPIVGNRLASRRTVQVASTPINRECSKGAEARPKPAMVSEAKRLALLRKDRAWNSKQFPLRKNCIELVRGALATRIERALGGNLIFIMEASKRRPERGSRRKGCEGTPIHDFRRKLLQKWPNIEEAFLEIDSYVSKVTRPLNVTEWSAALAQLGLATQANGRVIYEMLDENKDGTLTLQEFRTGVEAAAPVFSLEALRKRLLCLGYPSMLAALSAMQSSGEDLTMVPLSFQQFSECLRRVWVIQPQEHRAIFDLVRDPCDPSATVTLAELLCGLVAVSPPLLLEELRLLSQRRYGDIDTAVAAIKAFCGLQSDEEEMDEEMLTRALRSLLGFTPAETRKLMSIVDIDGVDGVSISELRSAVLLAEPVLTVEGLRRKVQQGYRSIAAALEDVVKQSPEFPVEEAKFQKEELALLLESIEGVTSSEMAAVISFVSRACGQQGITIEGFLKGLRVFAPCSVLEALRLQLLGREAQAFSQVADKRLPLEEEQFAREMEKANMRLPAEEASAIFHLLDIRNAGVVTLGEFIALLQCSRPVGRPFRNTLELERSAASRVRKDFAPIRRGLRDLKQGIRSATSELAGQVASFPEAGRALAASTSLPDLREAEAPLARKTFQRISSTLSRVPDLDEMGTKIVEIRDGIGGYFESHHRSLSCHEELLEQPVPSRASQLHHRVQLP